MKQSTEIPPTSCMAYYAIMTVQIVEYMRKQKTLPQCSPTS